MPEATEPNEPLPPAGKSLPPTPADHLRDSAIAEILSLRREAQVLRKRVEVCWEFLFWLNKKTDLDPETRERLIKALRA